MGGGVRFGRAEYVVGADIAPLQKSLGLAEKEFVQLASKAGQLGGALDKAFNVRVLAAFDAQLARVGKSTRAVLDQIMAIGNAGQKPIKLLEEGNFDHLSAALVQLGQRFAVLQQEIRELSSVDPVVGLVRSGATVTQAMDQVIAKINLLEQEIKELEGIAKSAERLQFVSPAFAQQAEIARNAAQQLRKQLHDLGVQGVLTNEQLSRPIKAPKVEVDTEAFEEALSEGKLFDTDKLKGETRSLIQDVQELGLKVQTVGEVSKGSGDQLTLEFEQARQQAEKLSAALVLIGRGFAAPKLTLAEELQRAAVAGKPLVDILLANQGAANKLNSTIAQLGKISGTGMAAARAEITKLAAEYQKLTGTAAPALKDLNKNLGLIGNNPIARILNRFTGAFDRFGQAIEDATGIAESDFAILLGAGLAGGFAGIIRITQKAIQAISDGVRQLREFNSEVDRSFRGSSDAIREFADTTASELGLSATEALRAAVAFEKLARSVRLNEEAHFAFSAGLTAITGAFEQYVSGLHTTEEAQKLVESAAKGSDEALAELGITLGALNRSAQQVFGKSFFGQLNGIQQVIARTNALFLESQAVIRRTGITAESASDKFRDAGRSLDVMFKGGEKKEFQEFQRALEDLDLSKVTNAVGQVGAALEGFNATVGNSSGSVNDYQSSLNRLKDAIGELGSVQLLVARQQVLSDKSLNSKERKVAVDLIDKQIAAIERVVAGIEKQRLAFLASAEGHKLSLELFREDIGLQRQAADAVRTRIEAEIDGNRQVANAERQLQRTREDYARKNRDLIRDRARAERDAFRQIRDAELELADTRIEARERIEDSQDRLDDAIREGNRDVRDAEEKIEDLERDHARKIKDAQEDKARAHQKAARDITEALIDIETALLRHDFEAFNAAQRQLVAKDAIEDRANSARKAAEEEEDFEIELARAKRDLTEAQEDRDREVHRARRDRQRDVAQGERDIERALRDVEDAQIDYKRAVQDTIRAFSDLKVEQDRAFEDAKRNIEEAQIARDRAIASATRAFERLAEQIGLATDEIVRELIALGMLDPFKAGFGGLFRGGFAAGGPVDPSGIHLVGERGPELFVPETSGQIISNADLKALLQGINSGNVTITVNEAVDAETTAFKVAARLARGVG